MKRKDLTARVEEAIKQTPEQTDVTIESLDYIFNDLHKKKYSIENICTLNIKAAEHPDSIDPDVVFIAIWLNLI
jgi:hypothetical protein